MKLHNERRALRPGIALILGGLLAAACGGGGGSGAGILPNPSGGGSFAMSAAEQLRHDKLSESPDCSQNPEAAALCTGKAAQAAESDDAVEKTPTPLENADEYDARIAGDADLTEGQRQAKQDNEEESDYLAQRESVSTGDFEWIPNDGGVGDFGDIGADAAYRRGYDGSGVVVGVVSADGFDGADSHTDLIGQFVAGYGVDTPGQNDHGTGVASVIAGARDGNGMHGVAPGAKISPILINPGYGEFAREHSGARILNFSWHNKISARWTAFYAEDPNGRNGLDPDGEHDPSENPELYSRFRYCGHSYEKARFNCEETEIYRAVSPLIPLFTNPVYSPELVAKIAASDILHVFSAGNEGRNAENPEWLRDRVLEKLYTRDENGKWQLARRVHADVFADIEYYKNRLTEYTNEKERAINQGMDLLATHQVLFVESEKDRLKAEAELVALLPNREDWPDSEADALTRRIAIRRFYDDSSYSSSPAEERAAAIAAGGALGDIAAELERRLAAHQAAVARRDAVRQELNSPEGLRKPAEERNQKQAEVTRLDEEIKRLRGLASDFLEQEKRKATQVLDLVSKISGTKLRQRELADYMERQGLAVEDIRTALADNRVYQAVLAHIEQVEHAIEADDPMKYPVVPTLPENYVASLVARTALSHSELRDIFLVAIGVEPEGAAYKIAESSNGCGDTKDFCLSAPNKALVATGDGDLEVRSGTSVAAAYVSGAAAVIMSAWPEMSAAEVSRLLRDTATPLCYRDGAHRMGGGACGESPDDTYGHGLLNLDEATRPQGSPEQQRIATAQGASDLPISESTIISSPAFANAFSADGAAVGMFDSYDRIFAYPLSALTSDNAEKARESFGLFAEDYLRGAGETAVGGGFAARIGADGGLLAAAYRLDAGGWQTAFSYAGHDCENRASAAGLHFAGGGGAPSAPCRARRTIYGFGEMFDSFADADLFALTERSAAAQTAVNVGGGIAAFSVGESKDAASDARYLRAAAKFAKRFGAAQLAAEIGHIKERDTVLGARFSGGLGMEGGGSTAYGRLAGLVDLTDGWRGYGSLIAGRTRATPRAAGAIAEISSLRSRGFHFGVGKSGVFAPRDSIRLDLSRPLAVTDGELVIDGRDPSNPHSTAQTRIDLAGDAHRRAALFYRRENGELGTAWGVEHIFNSPARGYDGGETVISAALRYDF